ncbi:MAG: Rne/Rng family ribonuclease [Bacteriovoracia bacterium]
MSTELIINASLPETRIALLEHGEIQELHIERDTDRGIVGNIYKGKVLRVLPGMQAAFVDIGLEKAAFLYVDDIFFPDMKTPLKTGELALAPQGVVEAAQPSEVGEARETEPAQEGLAPSQPTAVERNYEPSTDRNRERTHDRSRRPDRYHNDRSRHSSGSRHRNQNTSGRGSHSRNHGHQGHQGHGSRRDYQGGRTHRDQRNHNMGGRNQRPDRSMERNDRRPTHSPIPRTPEDHAQLQREYAKYMLDLDESDQLIEEQKRISAAKAQPKPQESQAEPPKVPPASDDSSDDEGNGPYRSEKDPNEPKNPEEENQPVARVATEAPADEEQDDSSQEAGDSAGVYRPEPLMDVQAWVQKEHEHIIEDLDHEEPPKDQEEDDDEIGEMPRRSRRESVNIADLVKEGQEILVQVVKDPIGTKGARLTCHVSLPGRYLVFMPSVDHVGVSRRIESDADRRRLKDVISRLRPAKTGVIVRTASSNQSDEKLKADLDYLVETWNEIQKKFLKQKTGTLVYQDLNIVLRAIRDMFTDEVDKVIVDNKREYKSILRFVSRFMPHIEDKIGLYEGNMPIFDAYGIESELAKALERKVWLKSGGYIVIDQAEALVAIDVNTGRYVGKNTLEETILQTNLEAVREIAYQLRIRNCGGIVIMDLIDMEKESNREKVYQALEEELQKDRARPTILKISQLGLVEMTRKRTRDTIVRTLCESCIYCNGRGFLKNKQTMAFDILRDIEREFFNTDTTGITIQCHTSVADELLENKSDVLQNLEHQCNKKVSIRANGAYHVEQYELVAHRGEKNVAYSAEERKQLMRQKKGEYAKQTQGSGTSSEGSGDQQRRQPQKRNQRPHRGRRDRQNRNRSRSGGAGRQQHAHSRDRHPSGGGRKNFRGNRNRNQSQNAVVNQGAGSDDKKKESTFQDDQS